MLQFTDDLRIGIDQVDAEHEYLFELLGRADYLINISCSDDKYDQIKGIMHELEEYTFTHFHHEEEYMESIRDSEIIPQKIQHNQFILKLHELQVKNINEYEEQQSVLQDLLEFLAKWLYQHIIQSDGMIGKMPPLDEWKKNDHPCDFTEKYMTYIPKIDEEHKKLFEMLARINDLVEGSIDPKHVQELYGIVDELRDYTVFHFSDEEEYMASISYAGLEKQKEAHKTFVDMLNNLDKADLESNLQENMEKLVEFLTEWLIGHILHMDKKIPKK